MDLCIDWSRPFRNMILSEKISIQQSSFPLHCFAIFLHIAPLRPYHTHRRTQHLHLKHLHRGPPLLEATPQQVTSIWSCHAPAQLHPMPPHTVPQHKSCLCPKSPPLTKPHHNFKGSPLPKLPPSVKCGKSNSTLPKSPSCCRSVLNWTPPYPK